MLCRWGRYAENEKLIERLIRDAGLSGTIWGTTPELLLAKKELEEYFAGKRRIFSSPVKLIGSDFRLRVWTEIAKVTYGRTITYRTLASRLGKPAAIRAAASACGANPVSIFVPCHRITAGAGLGGYAGGVDRKLALLRLEASNQSFSELFTSIISDSRVE